MTSSLSLVAPSSPSSPPSAAIVRALLSDAQVLRRLRGRVQRCVPAQDIDDVLHDGVCKALESTTAPEEREACLRWLDGLLRHQIADYHRARRLERGLFRSFTKDRAAADPPGAPGEPQELDPPAPPEPKSARDRLAWVKRQVEGGAVDPEGLLWIVRAADGESLESLSREAGQPAGTVRWRVSKDREELRRAWERDSTPPPSQPAEPEVIVAPEPRRGRRPRKREAESSGPAPGRLRCRS